MIDAKTRIELEKRLEELAPHVSKLDYVKTLDGVVKDLKGERGEALRASSGTIVLLGMWHNGMARVQFNDDTGKTFPSYWNEHLFKIAREAYLSGRRVVVLSVGDPVGPNILLVSLVSSPFTPWPT